MIGDRHPLIVSIQLMILTYLFYRYRWFIDTIDHINIYGFIDTISFIDIVLLLLLAFKRL